MKTKSLFKEYIWIVNTIRKRRKISLNELNEIWLRTEMSEGVDIARNTFLRHKNSIEEIFGINIECDVHDGYRYYIHNEEVFKENSVQNWMLSTISVSNILTENIKLNEQIMLESIPCGGDLLKEVIDAMTQKVRICVTYQKYGDDKISKVTFAPYCIRLFQCRWYVLGQFQRPARDGETPIKRKGLPKGYIEYFITYSLDRIKSIELTRERFQRDKSFSATEYFYDCYGINKREDVPVEKIVIRAFGQQRYYMRDLPWHHSQIDIKSTDSYSDFEMYLSPTTDFINHIVKYGNYIKVIRPNKVIDAVKAIHKKALEVYD